MPHIQALDQHMAELIAAGEVVERPASVVKELVENSVDAGASAVAVSVRRGGMALIRVTDDGCGIAPDELPTAFLRHATSKLRSPEDLGRIGTLGFRGEALAAIAAVSRVEIQTREKDAPTGAVLRLEGGVPGEVEETGAPEGTTISVRDLFYNAPARFKFMRKDSAEAAAIGGLMQRLALSHPEISFRFSRDGAEALWSPGDGTLASAVYAALGRDFALSLIEAEGRSGDVSVSGLVTRPLQCRGSRSMQVFFVNGRLIKSPLLTAALEEGYRDQMMKGRFPGCVLTLTMPPELVDPNVHPAKTQVKFAREREVFDAVYHTTLDALARKGSAVPAPETRGRTVPKKGGFQTMDAKTWRERTERTGRTGSGAPSAGRGASRDGGDTFHLSDSSSRYAGHVRDGGRDRSAAHGIAVTGPEDGWDDAPGGPGDPDMDGPPGTDALSHPGTPPGADTPPGPGTLPGLDGPPGPGRVPAGEEIRPFTPAIPSMAPDRRGTAASESADASSWDGVPASNGPGTVRDDGAVPEDSSEAPPVQERIGPEEDPPWRIAGELFRTYIVCESADGKVWIIDKHAAHERINYDRLKASAGPPMRQVLLVPAAVDLDREDARALLEDPALLERLGFACEAFGEGTVLVREVPADLDPSDAAATLEELAADLRGGRGPEERRDAMFKTMACRASVKGGQENGEQELRVLVERVRSGDVRFCPHGRPVAAEMDRSALEKLFRRT